MVESWLGFAAAYKEGRIATDELERLLEEQHEGLKTAIKLQQRNAARSDDDEAQDLNLGSVNVGSTNGYVALPTSPIDVSRCPGVAMPPIPEPAVPWGDRAMSPALQRWCVDQLKHPLGTVIRDTVDGVDVIGRMECHTFYGLQPDRPETPHKGITLYRPTPTPDATSGVGAAELPPTGPPGLIPVRRAQGGIAYVTPAEALAAGALRHPEGGWDLRNAVLGPAPVPGPPAVQDEAEAELAISGALSAAGANTLPEDARKWLWGRVGQHRLDRPTNNLGGLRPSGLGCGNVSGLEKFGSVEEGAQALVSIARRAGATAQHPAPDLEPLEVGWVPLMGPDDKAKAVYAQLRADWAGFKTAGVGRGKLAFLQPDVDAWNKFSAAWERSDLIPSLLIPYQDGDLGPPLELGQRLNVQVETANRVRSEIATVLTGKPIAPGDLEETRRGHPEPEGANVFGRFTKFVDEQTRDVPWLGKLTAPAQSPGQASGKILLAGLGLGALLVGAVMLPGAIEGRVVRAVEARRRTRDL